MINQTTRVFQTKSKRFSIMLPLQSQTKGTSRTKLYKELGIESLSFCRWFRRLCTFYKVKTQRVPKYLYKLIPLLKTTHMILALQIQLVHAFVEQMPPNTPFSLKQFGNGIN